MSLKKDNKELLWGCCDVGLQDVNYIKCTRCYKAFHCECLSVSIKIRDNKPSTSKWVCPLCTQKSGNNDNTPVPTPCVMDMQNKFRDSISDILTKELKPLKEEICEMRESMNFINQKYETIVQDNADAKHELRQLREVNTSMQSKINDLTNRVNQLEINSRMANLEIQCMPEKNDENLLKIITQLGKTVKCNISEDNLAHYTRIAKLNRDSVRPRSIVVQFNSPKMRDQYLAAAINYNRLNTSDKLNSSHAGLTGLKTPIFICEHLSATNKALHAAARQAAKDKGYKYVWVRSGRVYMRKTEQSEYKIIRDINTLNNLL